MKNASPKGKLNRSEKAQISTNIKGPKKIWVSKVKMASDADVS